MLESVRLDLRHVARMWRRTPGVAAAAVLTLALGIGGTTTIFSVVHAVLLKPLPYPEPDALVRIVHSIGGINQAWFSDAIYLTYADNTRAFDHVGVWSPDASATITGLGEPEEAPVMRASRGVLTALGVQPAVGRWFTADEDMPGSPDTVILAGGYWQRRFGGDPDVLARAITINGRRHQVIGVMPASFRFDSEFDIILPLRIDHGAPSPGFRLLGIARMKPGVTLAQANTDAARVLHLLFERTGMSPAVRARWAPALVPLTQHVVGDVGRTLWIVMSAIVAVLLMACGNVANLLLVRAEARRQELAIRAAMGASRARLARQLLAESLSLALVGGAVGVGLAAAGVRVLRAIEPPNVPRLSEITLDPTVLGFALALSIASGIVFGLVPIVRHAHPRLAQALGAGSRGAGSTRERQRSQQAMVMAQIALAIMLLVSAGLMIRSFQSLRRVEPGFTQPARVQTFGITIPPNVVADPARVTQMQQAIVERLGAIPGVAGAAFTTRLPMGPDRSSAALTVEGVPDDGRTPPNRQVKVISPSSFRTLGTPLVAGRDFTWIELHGRRDVAIVSENLARRLWGAPGAALGKRLREYYDPKSPWCEVVGVVANVHDDGVHQPAPETLYRPAQPQQRLFGIPAFQTRRVVIVLRTDRAGSDALLGDVREAVRSISATLPLAQVRTLDEVYRQSMTRTSFTLVILAIAGTMALLLAVSGIYSVTSYAVSQRRREIGIRLALGAQREEIRRLFTRQGLIVVGLGIAIGLFGALSVTRSMQSLLFGVSPLDPLTFVAMPIVLAAAAVLAGYGPARRAMSVDPVETMRSE